MTKKRWFVLVALVVLGGAIYAVATALAPATRFVYGVAPIGPDEAVLLTRRNEDDATRYWAQLVRTDGAIVWNVEVSPFETREALGFTGVAASADRVVLFGSYDGAAAGRGPAHVLGLARADGARIWETPLGPEATVDAIGPAFILDGPRVYVVYEKRTGAGARVETMTALALADGAVLWTLAPGDPAARWGALQATLLGPGRLALRLAGGETLVELSGVTGKVMRALPLPIAGCDAPGGLVGSDSAANAVLRLGHAEGAALTRVSGLGDAFSVYVNGLCGERGGEVVVGLLSRKEPGVGLARVDPTTGVVRWNLPLGAVGFEPRRFRPGPGGLPRFLPIVVDAPRSADALAPDEIVVVDLDQGTIIGRYRVGFGSDVLVSAEHAYVLKTLRGVQLLGLDPATGAVASVLDLQGVDTFETKPEDYAFGRLWLTGSGWAKPADLGWAVIDLARPAASIFHGGVSAIDRTADGWAALQ